MAALALVDPATKQAVADALYALNYLADPHNYTKAAKVESAAELTQRASIPGALIPVGP